MFQIKNKVILPQDILLLRQLGRSGIIVIVHFILTGRAGLPGGVQPSQGGNGHPRVTPAQAATNPVRADTAELGVC